MYFPMSHREGFTPPVPLPMASGDVIVVTGGHRGKPTFLMILGDDLMPTSDDMRKFVDIIMVNRGHLA